VYIRQNYNLTNTLSIVSKAFLIDMQKLLSAQERGELFIIYVVFMYQPPISVY